MVRVLHVLGGLGLGGAESRIMDMYRHINRDKVQFDFLVHSANPDSREPQHFDSEVLALGGHIYVLPKFKVYNYFAYKKAVKKFFEAHSDYSVVQGHMTSTAGIYLPIAKKAGVGITVAHSRSAGVWTGLKGAATRFFRRNLDKKADVLFACSNEAAVDAFGQAAVDENRVVLIHNAVNTKKFSFNQSVRDEVRKEYNLGDSLVLGSVARFSYIKNHKYMLEVLRALTDMGTDAKLLLLGDGELVEDTKTRANQLGIADRVVFAGNRKDPERFYQAMDIFLLPSLYEGLPGVLVEAQSAGLQCIASDVITREAVGVEELVTYISIEGPAKVWAKHIEKVKDYKRYDTHSQMVKAGFDVDHQILIYEDFYIKGDYSGFIV